MCECVCIRYNIVVFEQIFYISISIFLYLSDLKQEALVSAQ